MTGSGSTTTSRSGYCDIVMSGVAVTTDRASRTMLSSAYLDETLAFVVPDAARERFATWDGIRRWARSRSAVPNVPYYVEKLRLLVPAGHASSGDGRRRQC